MPTNLTPDQIWDEDISSGRQADLFNRRQEAEHLIAYIESVVGRPALRDDKRAYTIAVDARYGEGKSFFLRRLGEHLSLNHPVAFVDAWADDLSDEPLTALAATLKAALEPFRNKPDVQDRLATFMSKTGKVAKIAGAGFAKRGASWLIGGAAVNAAADILAEVPVLLKETTEDGVKDTGQGIVGDVVDAAKSVNAQALMESRVAAFEEGKNAVKEMKRSLSAIVSALGEQQQHPPIIIIIDELDRCRPPYAVKLLEEIKHLFDVPGLVFVLALHADQLAHSVSGAYGAGFDGRAYLRRFIDREYRLAPTELTPLIEQLVRNAALPDHAFDVPGLVISKTRDLTPSLPEVIGEYMRVYGVAARDAFELLDMIQTSVAILRRTELYLPYFLPLAIGMLKGHPIGHLPDPENATEWRYVPNWTRNNNDAAEISFEDLATSIHRAAQLSRYQLSDMITRSSDEYPVKVVWQYQRNSNELATIQGYPRLLGAVSRFNNPQRQEMSDT